MARRKNVKRIDPRYFLHETVNRNDDGTALEEADDPLQAAMARCRDKAKGDPVKYDECMKTATPSGKPRSRNVGDSLKELEEEQSIFAPNHYCVHHGGVQHEGQIKMAEAVNHNYDRKLNRVTHYDMRLQDGTILESVPAEDIQVVRASLAEEHSHDCPSEEGDVASDISQLSPEEAFAAGMAAARDAIEQAMGGPDGPAPEGDFAAEPAMD